MTARHNIFLLDTIFSLSSVSTIKLKPFFKHLLTTRLQKFSKSSVDFSVMESFLVNVNGRHLHRLFFKIQVDRPKYKWTLLSKLQQRFFHDNIGVPLILFLSDMLNYHKISTFHKVVLMKSNIFSNFVSLLQLFSRTKYKSKSFIPTSCPISANLKQNLNFGLNI